MWLAVSLATLVAGAHRPPASAQTTGRATGQTAKTRAGLDLIGAAAEATKVRRQWAVIVGIDAYDRETSKLGPLDFAGNDAREIAQLLKAEFNYKPNDVRLLPPTARSIDITGAVDDLLGNPEVGKDDSFLFFFAGHGLIDRESGDTLLAATDSVATGFVRCVSAKGLVQSIDKLPCRQKLIVLDSCFSGRLFNDAEQVASPDAFFGISAGRDTPVADGDGERRHSIFTAALLGEMHDRADSPRRDAIFTLRDLAPRVRNRVQTNPKSRQDPEWGRLRPGGQDFWFRPSVLRARPIDRAAVKGYAAQLLHAAQVRLENPEEANRLLDACPPELRHWEWQYLRRLCHTKLYSSQAPAGPVVAMDWSPRGDRLALAGGDRRVYVLEGATGDVRLTLEGQTEAVTSVAFSRDGSRIVAGAADGRVVLWDASDGRQVGDHRQHTGPVLSLSFDPSGTRLASGGGPAEKQGGKTLPAGELLLWDLPPGRGVRPVGTWKGQVVSVAFSPDGTLLAAASKGGSETEFSSAGALARMQHFDPVGKVWDLGRGAFVSTLEGAVGEGVGSLVFNPDGQRLGSIRGNESISLWEPKTGRRVLRIPYEGYNGTTNLVFSPDGKRVAAGAIDWTIKLWDTSDGRQVATLRGENTFYRLLAFHPSGLYLASADGARLVLWDLQRAPASIDLSQDDDMVFEVAFNPSGDRLASASVKKSLRVWDVEARRSAFEAQRGIATGVKYDPKGATLAVSVAGGVDLLNADTGKLGHSLRLDPQENRPGLPRRYTSFSACFSPDGSLLAFPNSALRSADVWDVSTGRNVHRFNTGNARGSATYFSPDGSILSVVATDPGRPGGASDAGLLIFFRMSDGRESRLETELATARCLATSPDGLWLAAGNLDGTITLHRLAIEQERYSFHGHADAVAGLAFSPDGGRLFSAGFDRTIKVWDVATRENVFMLVGHQQVVRTVALGKTGWLASASKDGAIRLWDGRPLNRATKLEP
jgi:WD40 repeat protein